MPRATCTVTGKQIWEKEEARKALQHFRAIHKGKGLYRLCPFCNHYHFTKGLRGNKGKGEHRRRGQ